MKQTFWDWLFNRFGVSLPHLVWKTEGEVFGYGKGEPVVRLVGLAIGPHIFFGFIRTKPNPRED